MLFSAARMLEINEATRHGDWLLEGRKTDIEDHCSGVTQKFSRAILEFTSQYPNTAVALLDNIARFKGFRFLGSGVDFSAYRETNTGNVVKIKRDSAGRPHDELVCVAEEIKHDHETLSHYFGSVAVPQTVRIAEHILGGGYQTVQISQPYVDVEHSTTPFVVNDPEVSTEALEALLKANIGADVALRELCHQSFTHFNGTGSVIDTNGANNVVVDRDGSVSLIDTVPVKPRHPATQLLIIKQLRSLQTSLDEVCV